MTPLFSVDCTCGRKVVVDSDTMRKVVPLPDPRDYENRGGRKTCASCGNRPKRCTCAPTRRVSLVDEYTLGDWDPEGDAA